MTAAKTQKKDQPNITAKTMSGAQMLLRVLKEQGVDTVFGYPGGAVLPIYDEIFQQSDIKHILVRHEQGALHAAEGYARSTGKVGCALVTSGPGATNAVTGLTDAMLDSIPVICISGQVPTFLIGTDAFQEADTVGITRACTKHNYLVKDINELAHCLHEAFHIARSGRPGPVMIDIPKDVQINEGTYTTAKQAEKRTHYHPKTKPDATAIETAIELMANAKRPIFYTGGGVINAGTKASELLRTLVRKTGFPITSTLMGLGAYPSRDKQWLGMLGMHGTYEANLAMHDCDVMICIGARFDDRITGIPDKFSPNSKKIHVDIDASSINKIIQIDIPIIADAQNALEAMLEVWNKKDCKADEEDLKSWWKQINKWRTKNCLAYEKTDKIIKPQYALERLRDALDVHQQKTGQKSYLTTEVGQHQMWAAQFMHFDEPNHWMTSGGLGTMGYGLPAAIGVQRAHPDAQVICIAGDASFQMNSQELATAIQHNLPVKVFILNNEWMGMVRQWQELLHDKRYSETSCAVQPDIVALAKAYGGKGFRARTVAELDNVIEEMLQSDTMTLVDVCVDPEENCFPMIPSGRVHNDMILSPEAEKFDKDLV